MTKDRQVNRPRADFDRLQSEILALSVFASAAHTAYVREYEEGDPDLHPADLVLLGHEWDPLAAAVLRRIAELADELPDAAALLAARRESGEDSDVVREEQRDQQRG